MWALSLAQAAPERATRVTVYGVPAVSLPGVKANAFFRLASTPGLGRLILRVPAPKDIRKATADVIGTGGLPDEFFAVVGATMRMPAWRLAMWSHLNLAFASGKPAPREPARRRRAARARHAGAVRHGQRGRLRPTRDRRTRRRALPDATVEVIDGAGHAPFLDGAYAYS